MVAPHHVSPAGPELTVAESPSLSVIKFSVGDMDNNVYLIRHADGTTVLIDAAADPERIRAVVGGSPDAVITTHRHHDHVGALAAVAAGTPRRWAGRPDAEAIAEATGVDDLTAVWDDDTITVGGIRLGVIGLVGHTPGSITLVLDEPALGAPVLFTGDSLFPGGPGKTNSPTDFASLLDDLETKVFGRFADDVTVHPGHGDSTTLGAERSQLGSWRDRGW